MKTKLTKKQALIIDFINDFTARQGESPSYREIMSALGLSSVSAVAEHIDNLVKKALLKNSWRCPFSRGRESLLPGNHRSFSANASLPLQLTKPKFCAKLPTYLELTLTTPLKPLKIVLKVVSCQNQPSPASPHTAFRPIDGKS